MAEIRKDMPLATRQPVTGNNSSDFNAPAKKTIINYFKNGYRREAYRMPFYWNAIKHHDFITHELTGLLFPIAEGRFSRLPKVQAVINRPDFFHVWFDKLYAADMPSSLSFVKILSSFDQMAVKPEQAFIDMLSNEIDFEKLSPRGLNDFIVATARINLPVEKDVLKKWILALGGKLEKYNNADMAICIWSLAAIDARIRNPELRDVARILLERYDPSSSTNHELSQINAAALWFQFPEYQSFSYTSDNIQSELEQNVRNAFARAGNEIFPADRHFLPALQRFVDIRMLSNGKHVVAEVDGPRHFIRNLDTNEFEFNGSTILQTAILGRLVPDAVIVRANYLHKEALRLALGTATASNEFARHLTDEFSRVKPGQYKTDIAGTRVSLKPFFDSASLPDYAPPYIPPELPARPSWMSRAYRALKGLNPLG
ncbi:MAG: hypothetical protein DI586_08660 [Micavibrio aeruginosavorus]|uniref:Uncharacterized protein n=1 Tax=Micavibrio aeruginosavorus TaxID=349221 RepID=A0A2W5HGW0_9BACT|nr:MAG: hypothetical protein DI586_08660 [Micavibrio aeruginosavorus]